MSNLIITINRENGSGGRYIGEKLAEELGMQYHDADLVLATAEKTGLDVDYVRKYDEKQPESLFYFGGQSTPSMLFVEESKVIRALAERESAVFVGRASDYILRDYPNVFNIFVHAPLGVRIERVSSRKGISFSDAERHISIVDRERAAYYNLSTRQKWGDATNYDLSVNTGKIGRDASVEIIRQYIAAAGVRTQG